MPKYFKLTTPFGTEVCTMTASTYAGKAGHIALQLWCDEGPFATLTTNLAPRGTDKNVQAVDVNNCPWAPALIKRLRIGAPTGKYVHSGFCTYPLYEFDMERIAYYCGKSAGMV